ncbi:hypothetical protein T265_14740 [Opisthorchis viverrini]|uniref:Cytosolic Fe-S cluster assembly factor NUBP1 homolog n=2 Tax=Opisthorchis viverrini TaxID=6198 RepID=A0A074ZI35_OPIVI|nr:hypothetical protein T265_14740 [Opisthorchis viverrini]KER22965.1 hypothetical protein T265_14740 [Opisthorchis viverrini]
MSDVPPDAPASCPGTQSEMAGKASACDGCPNQAACSSGQANLPLSEREPDVIANIHNRLGRIHNRILILSGKGGVGKSSLAVCLARGLCRRVKRISENYTEPVHAHCTVGLLDLDLCGPSIPCMLGCMNEKVHQSQSGWSPVFVSENLAVMSVGFLLPSPDHAVIWRGPRKNALIRQLLTDVCWTEANEDLDFLLIDTPPGTSDEHLSSVQYLQAAGCLDGAVIVTTPQEVSLSDVRKEINFCQKLSVPILGVVENMSEFVCPACGHTESIFPPTTGGAASLCSSGAGDTNQPPLLGRIPLDPRLARALDEGICPFELAEANEDSIDDSGENNLRSTDRIIVTYATLIDRLLERLHSVDGKKQLTPLCLIRNGTELMPT